jgi:hypothetical protein
MEVVKSCQRGVHSTRSLGASCMEVDGCFELEGRGHREFFKSISSGFEPQQGLKPILIGVFTRR